MTSPHIVILGPPGSGKSRIGLRLARCVERPFLDVDNDLDVTCGSKHPVAQDSGRLGHQRTEWFDRMIRVRGAAVIAAPWAVAERLVDELGGPGRPGYWSVLLDDDLDELRRRLLEDGAAPAAVEELGERWHDHRRSLDELRRVADLAVSTAGRSVDDLVDDIHEEWRHAQPDRTDGATTAEAAEPLSERPTGDEVLDEQRA